MKQILQVPVNELRPGQCLAEALSDENGRVLIPAGAELSEQTIAGLIRRQVTTVAVAVELESSPEQRDMLASRVNFQLDGLFRHAGESEEIMNLRQAIFDYRMGHLS